MLKSKYTKPGDKANSKKKAAKQKEGPIDHTNNGIFGKHNSQVPTTTNSKMSAYINNTVSRNVGTT